MKDEFTGYIAPTTNDATEEPPKGVTQTITPAGVQSGEGFSEPREPVYRNRHERRKLKKLRQILETKEKLEQKNRSGKKK